jgi:acyl transferase domain-containing protein/acyl carrier protein
MSRNEETPHTGLEIAVIGMSGRFPGARNIEEFWDNLRSGRESIAFYKDEELEEAGIPGGYIGDQNYVKSGGGVLEDYEYFDGSFFEYSPREIELMDPQLRHIHQCCWEALEDAGVDPYSYDGSIGLYVGASENSFWKGLKISAGKYDPFSFEHNILINRDFFGSMISYKLNLKGPAVCLQTACSTSLVAVHVAARALLTKECDMALAGGVSVDRFIRSGYLYQENMINSPDGHCRAFDAEARGTTGGNGVGIAVLTRLKSAVTEGYHIYAVIKGSAVNNDGNNKVGYTAPGVKGQVNVIKTALYISQVEPHTIGYIEAHGSGTALGDQIEIKALNDAFSAEKRHFCAIGSVKTNIGHLDAAAGIVGFIKTALALKYKQIPPSLHFEKPDPRCDFENSPFYVNNQLRHWENGKYPLRAGVSSFGIGGTNAHVILEEAPEITDAIHHQPSRSIDYELILLSAKTEPALEKITENLAGFLKRNRDIALTDVAYTLQIGRHPFKYRKKLVASTTADVIDILDSLKEKESDSPRGTRKVQSLRSAGDRKFVVFMFPGLGAQYVNMGLKLYRNEPVFCREMDRCFEILTPLLGSPIKEVLYPGLEDTKAPGQKDEKKNGEDRGIHRVEISQLAVFILEYALARLLITWGIKPDAMIGYSFGEYAAACISGVLTLNDALELIVCRGELIQKTPAGSMLSVPLSCQELQPLIDEFNSNGCNEGDDVRPFSVISLAIDNGPSCIVAGDPGLIDAFAEQLKERKYLCMRLPASWAIHSVLMAPILKEFEEKAGQLTLKEPEIPYISNVTGHWLTAKEATDHTYWSRHLREPVRFADGIKELVKEANSTFIEVGPSRDLSSLIIRYVEENPEQRIVNLVRAVGSDIPDDYYLLNKIGQLWLYGVQLDWHSFYAFEKRRRLSLPSYPFERRRYESGDSSAPAGSPDGVLSRKLDISDWFYIPGWKKSFIQFADHLNIMKHSHWLIFVNESPFISQLVKKLKQDGLDIILVTAGPGFGKTDGPEYTIFTIDPKESRDYRALFDELHKSDWLPGKILHLWNVTEKAEGRPESLPIEQVLDLGFYSLLYLTKAVERRGYPDNIQVEVVSNNMQAVTGDENLCPGKAALLGPVKVVPQEYPFITLRSIDVVIPEPGSVREKKFIDQLKHEFVTETLDPVIAFRGGSRWVQTFEPSKLDKASEKASPLREGGVYFISGGLGTIGLVLAQYLAKNFQADLILTGRSPLPAVDEWDNWLNTHGDGDSTGKKIAKIRELEAVGSKVLTLSCDVAEEEQMKKVVLQAEKQLGQINGVIHAAGMISGESIKSIHDIERKQCEEQFRAKIYGIVVLEKIFSAKELDFCWIMSSVSSVLGGLNFIAYSAANIFMDAFVCQYNQFSQRPWISVNWDGMEARDTTTAFQRLLSLKDVNQVVVLTGGNLQEKIDQWVKLKSIREEDNLKKSSEQIYHPRPDLSSVYVSPGSQLEQRLAEIWQAFFGIEQIGIHDDFFELGGDSLKAITMISKIHKEFNVKISLAQMFNAANIRKLAGFIGEASEDRFVSIRPTENKEYYKLSSAQKRMYLLQQADLDNTVYNETQVIPVSFKIEKQRLEAAFKKLVRRHESLRTSIRIWKNEPVQVVHEDFAFSLDYFETDGREMSKIVNDFVRPFDLRKIPFFRVGWINARESQNILIFDIHHIVFDAVSMALMMRDLLALYTEAKLPPLPLQYRDYAEWQNNKVYKELIKEQEKYWLGEYEGELPVLKLPTDYERPGILVFEGDRVNWQVGEKETKALKEIANSREATLNMTILAIYNILLSKLSGREDIIVGMPTIGRRHADLDNIVGIFINTLALRSRPKGERTFLEFLGELRQKNLEAFDNQEYPFEYLVEKIIPRKDLGRNPIFDVVFSPQNFDESFIAAGESGQPVQADGLGYDKFTAKFDLTLFAREVNEKLHFIFEYSTKLFTKETAERFAGYFEEIVSTITAAVNVSQNSDIRLADIKISHDLMDSEAEVSEMDFEFS